MQNDNPAALAWRKSSFSNSGGCVEAAVREGTAFVRDSKHRNGGTLSFSTSAWLEFIDAIHQSAIL
jgi:Domain of unknown function (DUF397)